MSHPVPPDMPGAVASSPALIGESDPFRPPKANTRGSGPRGRGPSHACIATRPATATRSSGGSSAAAGGSRRGFWCCPTPGCGGKGFLLDIHPTDPNWRDEERRGMVGGWFDDEGNPVPPPFGESAW